MGRSATCRRATATGYEARRSPLNPSTLANRLRQGDGEIAPPVGDPLLAQAITHEGHLETALAHPGVQPDPLQPVFARPRELVPVAWGAGANTKGSLAGSLTVKTVVRSGTGPPAILLGDVDIAANGRLPNCVDGPRKRLDSETYPTGVTLAADAARSSVTTRRSPRRPG
jgi:hypothetical protein